ncbi:unnamed protein product [Caenorhabditis angaria]|uniref:Neuropeptide-Like Protein n=1 Tax=Caenorhabditis angaria TaxID=860376 RepID=A0A9P1IW10_9PELO|nr:unnamed protein product [Caenorhabditis angaria]
MVSSIQIFLLVAFFSTIVFSYSVLPEGFEDYLDGTDREMRFIDEIGRNENAIRLKRDSLYYAPFNKRNSLKRLVILSARGFGKR